MADNRNIEVHGRGEMERELASTVDKNVEMERMDNA